jgi:hypothetical protein
VEQSFLNVDSETVAGIPKGSDFEPDPFVAEGNGKPPQIASRSLRFAAGK